MNRKLIKMKQYKSLMVGGKVTKIRMLHDASILSALSGGHTIALFDTHDYRQIASFTFPNGIRDYALAPDASKIAVVTAQENRVGEPVVRISRLHLYNISAEALEAERSLSDVRSVIFLSEHGPIATGRLGWDNDGSYIDFFDLSLSIQSNPIQLPNHEMAWELEILPKLNMLVAFGIGLLVWDIPTKKLLQQIHCDNLHVNWDIWEVCCGYALSEQNLLAIGFDSFGDRTPGEQICLFNPLSWPDRKWFAKMERFGYPTNVALSSDGKWLAATLSDKMTARIWNIQDGILYGECVAEGMSAVAFSPNNQYLITGANPPEALSLWEIEAKGSDK